MILSDTEFRKILEDKKVCVIDLGKSIATNWEIKNSKYDIFSIDVVDGDSYLKDMKPNPASPDALLVVDNIIKVMEAKSFTMEIIKIIENLESSDIKDIDFGEYLKNQCVNMLKSVHSGELIFKGIVNNNNYSNKYKFIYYYRIDESRLYRRFVEEVINDEFYINRILLNIEDRLADKLADNNNSSYKIINTNIDLLKNEFTPNINECDSKLSLKDIREKNNFSSKIEYNLSDDEVNFIREEIFDNLANLNNRQLQIYNILEELYESEWNEKHFYNGRMTIPLTRDVIKEIVDRNPTKLSDLEGIPRFPLDGFISKRMKNKLVECLELEDDLPSKHHIYEEVVSTSSNGNNYTRKRIDRMKEEQYNKYFDMLKDLENIDSEGGKQKTTEDGRTSTELLLDIIDYEKLGDTYYDGLLSIIGTAVKEQGIRPYQVFGNKEILTLLYYKPTAIANLEGLKGFPKGGARITKYGNDIVKVFKQDLSLKDSSLGYFGNK